MRHSKRIQFTLKLVYWCHGALARSASITWFLVKKYNKIKNRIRMHLKLGVGHHLISMWKDGYIHVRRNRQHGQDLLSTSVWSSSWWVSSAWWLRVLLPLVLPISWSYWAQAFWSGGSSRILQSIGCSFDMASCLNNKDILRWAVMISSAIYWGVLRFFLRS